MEVAMKIVRYGFYAVLIIIVVWAFWSVVKMVQPSALEYTHEVCGARDF